MKTRGLIRDRCACGALVRRKGDAGIAEEKKNITNCFSILSLLLAYLLYKNISHYWTLEGYE